MRRQEINELTLYITLICGVLSVLLTVWIVKSHNEAKVFSRITGRQVSTWDAMWIELRIQDDGE